MLSAPEWVNDENFTFKIHGRDVLKAKDGKPNPMKTGADGIALSGDKQTLYWTNLTGNRLLALPFRETVCWPLPTALIRDFGRTEDEYPQGGAGGRDAAVQHRRHRQPTRANNLYLTALTLNGIMKRDAQTGQVPSRVASCIRVSTLVASDEISWPDTLAWGPGGALYLVSNHLRLWVDGDMDFDQPKVPNFRIYRLKLGVKPYHAK